MKEEPSLHRRPFTQNLKEGGSPRSTPNPSLDEAQKESPPTPHTQPKYFWAPEFTPGLVRGGESKRPPTPKGPHTPSRKGTTPAGRAGRRKEGRPFRPQASDGPSPHRRGVPVSPPGLPSWPRVWAPLRGLWGRALPPPARPRVARRWRRRRFPPQRAGGLSPWWGCARASLPAGPAQEDSEEEQEEADRGWCRRRRRQRRRLPGLLLAGPAFRRSCALRPGRARRAGPAGGPRAAPAAGLGPLS